MATGKASASVLHLGINDAQDPIAIRHSIANMNRIVAGMFCMTRSAAASSYFLIDVEKMQIEISIAEIRESGCFGFENQILFVTMETKFIALHFKRYVEIFWEIQRQEAKRVRTMDFMARQTIFLTQRAMEITVRS